MSINLSDSEWKLMNHLWEQSPRTITELTAAVKGGNRLVQKHRYHHACPAGGQGRRPA